MTPYEKAARWWVENCPNIDFTHEVEQHFIHGHVISSPEIFLMGRRVHHRWPLDLMIETSFVAEDGDCWYVTLFAGDLREVIKAIPYELPYIAFHRGEGRIHIHKTERLLRCLPKQ